MVAPVVRSTSALLLPLLLISNACWARLPKTFEQFSTRMIGSLPLPLVSVALLLYWPTTYTCRARRLEASSTSASVTTRKCLQPTLTTLFRRLQSVIVQCTITPIQPISAYICGYLIKMHGYFVKGIGTWLSGGERARASVLKSAALLA